MTTETLPKTKTRKRLDIQFLTMKLMTGLPRFACIPLIEYDAERAALAVMTDEGRIMLGGQSWDGIPADENLLNMNKLGTDLITMLAGVVDLINRGNRGRLLRMPNWGRIEQTLSDIRVFREKFDGVEGKGPDAFDRAIQAPAMGRWVNIRSLTFYTAFPSSRMPKHIRSEVEYKLGERKYGTVHVAWEATWTEALRLSVGAERRQMDAPLDPIAFAQDLEDGHYYILGTWDLTKLESYIVSEFTEGA